MFNKDFYPTPDDVIEHMLCGIDINNKVILEPSAGKGNIVDYLQRNGAKEVMACEINNDLAKIVASKCRILSADFLNVESVDISHIDLIVMNPPFSADERHILHAYEIAPPGCTIVSLCNANTINNAHTEHRRKLQECIGLYGRSETFGSCFDDSERKTGVEIACIYLCKPKDNEDEFSDYFSLDEEEEQSGEGLIRYNYAREIVGRYNDAVHRFNAVMVAANEINEITNPISKYGIKFGAHRMGEATHSSDKITYEMYKKELQKQCWNKVFADMKMDKYLTKGVKETINKFVEQQVHVPFTVKNIYKMVEVIVGTNSERMGKVLLEAFENICGYSWKENCTGGEGWKTNSDYMVNRRFIVPYICESTSHGYPYQNVNIGYRSYDRINDIAKALCFLVGNNYDDTITLETFVRKQKMDWGQWYDWGFFRIRGYKKGTMHFEFLDEDVWMNFNRKVAGAKGWRLPGGRTSKKNKK